MTLRQCLTHTAGLREYYTLCAISGVPLAEISEERLIRLIAGQRDLDFEPGTAYSYSNSGYMLAAAVIRRLTGQSVTRYAAEHIFGPLGMGRTHFRDDLGALVPGLANGYAPDPGRPGEFRRADPIEECVGDGGIVTSIRDLVPWQAFLLAGKGLGVDIRDGLLDRAVLADGTALDYANGLEHTVVADQPGYAHTGAISGFRSVILCLPGAGLGVSVLANRVDVYPALIARWVANLALGAPANAGRTDPIPVAEAEASRAGLIGSWHDPERDVLTRLDPGPDGRLEQPGGDGERSQYALAADGAWYGEGSAVSMAYQLDGERLLERATVGEQDLGRFERVPTPTAVTEPPAGAYYSQELAAFATFEPGRGADPATVTIGLSSPRPLEQVAPDGYLADRWLTLRIVDAGQTLLVSADGAHHVRFAAVPPASEIRRDIRGLT